jgi:predicted  nucleic acid-binding Zn-ribbon protein
MSVALDEATKRFQAALGLLDAAVGRRVNSQSRRSDLETELQIMQDDRTRLATELESTAARLGRAQGVADHLGRRIDSAIGTIQEILAEADGEPATEA